jgi:AAA+ superfamily predicted ATPase
VRLQRTPDGYAAYSALHRRWPDGIGRLNRMLTRITDAFVQARRRAKETGAGLLIIDEADDVATARAQNQAHHEDRAGLNVLIKQIDQLARAKDPLVTILITNRHGVLDPAIRRRTALHLTFVRPDAKARAAVFGALLGGVKGVEVRMQELVEASAHKKALHTYSDLVDRLARSVLREAQRRDIAISVDLVLECLSTLEPSPLMDQRI